VHAQCEKLAIVVGRIKLITVVTIDLLWQKKG